MSARTLYIAAVLVALTLAASLGASVSSGGSSRPAAERWSRGAAAPPARKIVRELPSLRTRTSNTYVTEEGLHVAELFTSSVNFREDGRWRPIDNTLEVDGNGVARNGSNGYEVALPAALEAAPVRITRGEDAIAFRLLGATGTRRINGASAVYASALPGVDVQYDALADAVKETLLLQHRQSPREFRFELDISPGLSVEARAGGLEVRDGDRGARFVVPAPVAWDAAGEATATSAPVDLEYNTATDQVVIRIDDEYVEDPDRRFPVSIDPYVALPQQPKDCYLSALPAEHNISYCGLDHLRIGTLGGSDHHTVLDFDAGENIPRNSTVMEAYVATWLKRQEGTTWTDWAMHAVTRPWVDNEVTWGRASAATAWTTPGGDVNPTAAHIKHMGGGWANARAYWAIPDQAQRWADGTEPDHGLLIKPLTPNPPNGYVLASANDLNSDLWPKLTIYYQPAIGDEGPFSSVYEWVSDTRLGVNVATGWPTVYDHDATASAAEPRVNVERFHNGGSRKWSPLGIGSKLAESRLLPMGNEDIVVEMPSGTWVRFPRRSDGTFDVADRLGEDATLSVVGGVYHLELPDRGERFVYDSSGRLSRRELLAGGATARYEYDANGRLKTVIDATNGVTTMTYDPTWGTLTQIAAPGGRTITYSVTGDRMRSRTVRPRARRARRRTNTTAPAA